MGLLNHHNYQLLVDALKKQEKYLLPVNNSGKVNIALVYPNDYSLGMTNLGYLTAHRVMTEVKGVGVERFFPSLKPSKYLPPPYYSFETARPLADFDIIAFSFSYEGDFDQIPLIFSSIGLPVLRSKRNKYHPILLCGGAAVASNPAALSDIFDIIIEGEAETSLKPLLENLVAGQAQMSEIAKTHGLWLPEYSQEPVPTSKRYDINLQPAFSHILTPQTTFKGAFTLEVMRGCTRNCSFCLARQIYFPPRPLRADLLCDFIDKYDINNEIALVAPSLFDHPQIEEILLTLSAKNFIIKNSSVKWEKLTPVILDVLKKSAVKTLTLAPETASKKLQQAMKKELNTAKFVNVLEQIAQREFEQVKLYLILGLPHETNEDLDATIDFLLTLSDRFPQLITASFSIFIPKNLTPWQHEPFAQVKDLKRKITYLKNALNKAKLKLVFESINEAIRQNYLSKVGKELAIEYDLKAKTLSAKKPNK